LPRRPHHRQLTRVEININSIEPAPATLPQGGHPAVNDDINVLALVKGRERYIFLYEDSQRAEALRVLGRFASNPQLSFTWYDAAVLSQKVRNSAPAAELPELPSRLRKSNLPQASDD
jgi:hypothetical protein